MFTSAKILKCLRKYSYLFKNKYKNTMFGLFHGFSSRICTLNKVLHN